MWINSTFNYNFCYIQKARSSRNEFFSFANPAIRIGVLSSLGCCLCLEQLGSNPGCCAIKDKPLIDFCWAQISAVLIKTPGAASEGPTMRSLFLPTLPQLGAAGYFCKTSLVCTRVYTAPELTQQTTTAC